jgi:TonB family protein
MSFHALIFGLYFFLKATQSTTGELIAQVELLDIRPEAPAVEQSSPARMPRSVRDFLQMALPKLPSAAQEAAVQDIETKALPSPVQRETLPQRRFVDKGMLDARPTLSLNASRAPKGPAAALSDVSAKSAAASVSSDLGDMDARPAIDLEEVGRKAVVGGGGSLRIDPNVRAARASNLAEIGASARPRAPAVSQSAAASGGILLADAAPARGPARLSPKLPYGYTRPGGEISLRERPAAARAQAEIAPPAQPQKAQPLDAALQPSMKSMELSGPLASRRVLRHELPSYPAWAREQGVQAEVMIRFFVSSDGRVRDRFLIEKTSGYAEMDQLCKEVLKKWLFVSLPEDAGDQWGIVTFRFRLR